MLLGHGGTDGGYGLYVLDGRLTWVHNDVAREFHHVRAEAAVPAGRHRLRFEFEATIPPDVGAGRGAGGTGQLYVDGELVGAAQVPVTCPLSLGLTSGVRVGSAPGAPVGPDITPPFEYGGVIHSVTIDVSGDLIEDDEATLRRLMARQ